MLFFFNSEWICIKFLCANLLSLDFQSRHQWRLCRRWRIPVATRMLNPSLPELGTKLQEKEQNETGDNRSNKSLNNRFSILNVENKTERVDQWSKIAKRNQIKY